jgi:hypothetical protein
LPGVLDSLVKFTGLIPAIITAGTAIIGLLTGFSVRIFYILIKVSVVLAVGYGAYWHFGLRETFANAWLKRFSDQYTESGFPRIWDFEPYELGDEMLEDLYNVAVHSNKHAR